MKSCYLCTTSTYCGYIYDDCMYAWVTSHSVVSSNNELPFITIPLFLWSFICRLAKPTIEFEGSLQTLSAEILGRLQGLADTSETEFNECLKPLLMSAWEHCQNDPEPLLVPMRGSFPQPGGPLRTTLVGHAGET